MCPGGVKAGLSLMSLEVLSIMLIIDVIRSTNSAAIALHVFLWIVFWIFPRLSDPGRDLYYNYQKPLRVWRHNENGLFWLCGVENKKWLKRFNSLPSVRWKEKCLYPSSLLCLEIIQCFQLKKFEYKISHGTWLYIFKIIQGSDPHVCWIF